MKTLLKTTAAAALALLWTASAHAAEYVKLKNGTPVQGEAVSYDEATKTLTFKLENGTTRKLTMDELDGRSVYLVAHSRVPKNDAAKQIRIGNLARDEGLYAHAVRHYEYAAKGNESMRPEIDKEVTVLKQKAAAFGMKNAKDALAKGNKAEAERWLVKLVEKVPGEPQAKEAAAMLEQHYTQTRSANESKAKEQAGDGLKQDLEAGKRHYDSMVEKTKAGLTARTAGSNAANSWEGAIKDGERTLKELDKVAKKYPDAASQETLAGYRKIVVGQMVEVHLHQASLLTTRSSYNEALAEANKALALDSTSESARSARARIEQAASERGGWIW
jgi:hypothetical protein